jgi:hypothetical protein
MRIRILYRPPIDSIDGIRLDRFEPGSEYDVGISLAALMLAEGWAQPLAMDEPALLSPFNQTPADGPRTVEKPAPSNLVREYYPPCIEGRPDVAADLKRDRRKRNRRP